MIRKTRTNLKRIWASVALLSLEMLMVLGIFFVSLFLFVYLVRSVFYLKNNDFDQAVFDALIPFVSERNNDIMQFFTFLGTHEFLIPANLLLIGYFLFIKKHKWYSIKIPSIALTSLLLMFVLKHSFGRERPLIPLINEAAGLSFPSGHALMAVTFYGLLAYIVWQSVDRIALKWLLTFCFIVLIILIGFSRIYLRVHYTSDVVAGYCMGLIWLVTSIAVVRRIERYSKRNIDPVVKSETVNRSN
jgi:undecaprenyl-diphosphatase